jgi:hypothetical protein
MGGECDGIPGQSRGVVSLAFLPIPCRQDASPPSSSRPDFAALRVDGVVETWRCSRLRREEDDDGEGCVPASYARVGVVKDLMMSRQGGDNGSVGGKGGATKTLGWCARRWVRPIAMVSSCPGNGGACGNPILATCNFVGGIAIIDSDRLSVAARHEAFPPPAASSSSSSSSRGGGGFAEDVRHTRGGRINVDVDTCLSPNDDLSALAMGGR